MSRRRVFRSTRCAAFGHPEFEVTIDSTIPDGDAQWLLGVLEKSVGEGRQFEDEETIEIGAAFLKAKVKDERLAIFEPHFRGMPMEWVEGVTQSLRNVRMQRDVAESVGLLEEHDQPSILKPLMIGTDVNETTATLFLSRANSDDENPGWFIGDADTIVDYNDPKNLALMSVYEAMIRYPQITMYLGLSDETQVFLSKDGELEIIYQGEPAELVKGSFLEALLTG